MRVHPARFASCLLSTYLVVIVATAGGSSEARECPLDINRGDRGCPASRPVLYYIILTLLSAIHYKMARLTGILAERGYSCRELT